VILTIAVGLKLYAYVQTGVDDAFQFSDIFFLLHIGLELIRYSLSINILFYDTDRNLTSEQLVKTRYLIALNCDRVFYYPILSRKR